MPREVLMQEALNRLAEYEDTLYSPEEIYDMDADRTWFSPVCIGCPGKAEDGERTEHCSYITEDLALCLRRHRRLCELAKADKEERIIMIPSAGGNHAASPEYEIAETALRKASYTLAVTNNDVNRYIVDAVIEKVIGGEHR